MAESEKEKKNLLMKVKERVKKPANPVYETAKETLMYRTVFIS